MNLKFVSAEEVARLLPYSECIPLMRESMTALSQGRTRQSLRAIVSLEDQGKLFGSMPGAMLGEGATFGAKLVSVFPGNFAKGKMSHQGLVVLFDSDDGAPVAVLEAGELTAIRTAAASAAATDALARADATRLAVLGYGEQAWRHVHAIKEIRPIEAVRIWGRSPERARRFAVRLGEAGIAGEPAETAAAAVADADIVCTVSAAAEPILLDADVRDGTHINAVGSSYAGPCEIDPALVARARYFADHKAGVLAQGAEYLRARDAGLIDESHVLGEIGEIFAGTLSGRLSQTDVTVYKSLGSIVQDLAAARHIVERLT
jgi:ornithine cyclodeaminase/alanine dehydrogenase-like protein (mu-crystallin family)